MKVYSNQVSPVSHIQQPMLKGKVDVSIDTSCDTDLNECFHTKLCEGKLLAKMLANSFSECDMDRIEEEFIQLSRESRIVRCAATSLLAPCPKQNLYRNIGFIIDVDQSNPQMIADCDVGSTPVDDQGYFLMWEKKGKCFTKTEIREGELVNPKSGGRFAMDFNDKKEIKRFETIRALKEYMVEKSKTLEKQRLQYNEVVCEYGPTSIIAIIVTFNREKKSLADKEQIFHDSRKFKELTEQKLGLKLPLFVFDCEAGTLSHQEI